MISGSTASLRAQGVLRYFGAAFLAAWLVGWAIGETMAAGFLLLILRSLAGTVLDKEWPVPGGEWIKGGAAALVILFLLLWLTMWTFGGIAAITELLRSLAGEDLISVHPNGVEIVRRAGPFRRTRVFDRIAIRRIRARRHDKALVLDTASGTVTITKCGTSDDRQAIADWLRRHLSLPDDDVRTPAASPPETWYLLQEGGSTRMTQTNPATRWKTAVVAWAVVGLIAFAWMTSMKDGTIRDNIGASAMVALITFGAAWVTWARREWIVQPSQLTSHRRFATWQSERTFRSGRLTVEHSTDSDNDSHYKLIVSDGEGRKTIASQVHDDAEVIDLGRWLSARTGFPLTLPHGTQPRRTSPVTDDEMRG